MLVGQICTGADWGCPQRALRPQDITASISRWATSPGRWEEGVPREWGARNTVRLGPGQGKELIPLLAGSQMATAPIPLLNRFNR